MNAPAQRIRRAGSAIDPRYRDVAIALGLAVVSAIEISRSDDIDRPWLATVATLACTLGLVARRSHPLMLAAGIAAALVVTAIFASTIESIGVLIAVVLAVYSVAIECGMRNALIGTGAVGAAIAVSILRDPTDTAWNIPPSLLLFVLVPFAAGRALRERAGRAARDALAAERARIARELHDVVAHGLSMIALQADAADAALERDPARAVEPVRGIAVSARSSLSELRRLLAMVRAPGEDDPLAPRPGVARLPELIEQVRRVGLVVDLNVEGVPDELAPGVDLTVFRIAQEALTNALRHSSMARVAVTLRYRPADVEIEVVDDGRPPSASDEGLGLLGMRERVTLYGGRLDAGPRMGGGYGVRATLPL